MRKHIRKHIYVKRSVKRKLLLVIIVFLIIISSMFIFYDGEIKPLIKNIAISKVEDYASECIYTAANEMFSTGQYKDIINITSDSDGVIRSITTDMSAINKLKTDLALKVLNTLDSYINNANIRIPFGSLTGINLFAGAGPDIPIRIRPVTSVFVDAQSRLSDAGINQTLYRVVLKVTITADIVFTGETIPASYDTEVIAAETVLVGTVPQVYAITK